MPVMASDFESPPKEVTLEWTLEEASYVIPKVDLKDTKLSWLIKSYLNSSMIRPGNYIDIDISLVKNRLAKKVKYKESNIKWIDLVARIADDIDADILVSPGKVKFVPREPKNVKGE